MAEETTEDLVRGLKAALDAKFKKVDDLGEKVVELEKFKKDGFQPEGEFKKKFDQVQTDLGKFGEELQVLVKKVGRPGGGADLETRSAGQQIAAGLKSSGLNASQPFGFTKIGQAAAQKSVMLSSNPATINQSALGSVQYTGMVDPVRQALTIRDVFPQSPMTGNFLNYRRQLARTFAADLVPEGALKPKGDMTFELVQTQPHVIAELMDVSNQALEDEALLAGYIDTELTYGVNLKEEEKLYGGAGGTGDIAGLTTVASAYNPATDGGPVPVDGVDDIRIAIAQVRWISKLPATFALLSPLDISRIDRLKDGNGNYLNAAVTRQNGQMYIWGRLVIESDTVTAGDFMVGSGVGAHIWDKSGLTVLASSENKDNFEKNMVTMRGEKRVAFEIRRADAFVYGALS